MQLLFIALIFIAGIFVGASQPQLRDTISNVVSNVYRYFKNLFNRNSS